MAEQLELPLYAPPLLLPHEVLGRHEHAVRIDKRFLGAVVAAIYWSRR